VATRNVHLFVFDTLSDWEPGYAVAGINNPTFQQHPDQFRVQTVASRPEPVTTMGGIRIEPDRTLAGLSAEESAMLILPGGAIWDRGGNPEAVEVAAADCSTIGNTRATHEGIWQRPNTGARRSTKTCRLSPMAT
jgi:hypothetical protein